MGKSNELLERLRAYADCAFLSDLHRFYEEGRFRSGGPIELSGAPYTLEDWTEAVRYVTHTRRTFASVPEALRFLTASPAGQHPPGGEAP